MKKQLILAVLASMCMWAEAETVEVKTFKYAGPYPVSMPVMIDSVDNNAQRFEAGELLNCNLALNNLEKGVAFGDTIAPNSEAKYALHLLGFKVEALAYTDISIEVNGLEKYELYVDGEESFGEETVLPGTHAVAIKYLSIKDSTENFHVNVSCDKDKIVSVNTGEKRTYTMSDVLHATHVRTADLSPNGKYLIAQLMKTKKGGQRVGVYCLYETATGRKLLETGEEIIWMPRSNRYYKRITKVDDDDIVAIDPETGDSKVIAENVPDGYYTMLPNEEQMIFTETDEAPAENSDVHEIRTPTDRQAGNRDRTYLGIWDLKTGLAQRMTFGNHNIYPLDITKDGSKMLACISEDRFTKRPTTLMTICSIDLKSYAMDTIVSRDGFIGSASFSPDGKQIVVTGSPEAFGGIGLNVGEGQTASMVDEQIFIVDMATKNVRAMTKDFNPNIVSLRWSKFDNMIYFNAENKDMQSMYRMNPATGKIEQLPTCEDMVTGFGMAQTSPMMTWFGQGANNSDRLYVMNTKTRKTKLIEDVNTDLLKDVELGRFEAWNFVNSKGDTITGRFFLPPHFDAEKKYPMIVNYYGGCSPTQRTFDGRYPHHLYAAMGYVVYVIEPSGATGFGQEFSARHVNTAGHGPAEDIIEGTKKFCEEHDYVDEFKIGCIGASYGGFMTMYLQTVTDIFAAAVSHAGISDHTSYWGEGYWGYSYSEVSMANSYPWSDKSLYVDQSPLYNADKINTPLLFVHGTADTNVPVGESIQLFTALKLLGRETAFVAVEGENHHILNYSKRIKWQNTIFAWFAKYLQNDPTWWNSMYGENR